MEPKVEVEITPGEAEEVVADPLLQIAETIGRVDSALSGISERLANQERRNDELWNSLEATNGRVASSESLATQAAEATEELAAEVEAQQEAAPALEVLDLEPPAPKEESTPEPTPKRPRGTFWEHL